MTTPVWTELVCRTCSTASPGMFSLNGKINVQMLRADSAKAGWQFKHDECFCSVKCLREHEAELRAEKTAAPQP